MSQRRDDLERLLARVKTFADTEDRRILLAYQLGRNAGKSRRWRERQKAMRAA